MADDMLFRQGLKQKTYSINDEEEISTEQFDTSYLDKYNDSVHTGFPEDGPAHRISVPKCARKKHFGSRSRSKTRLQKIILNEEISAPNAMDDKVIKRQGDASTELTAEERKTKSVRRNEEFVKKIIDFAEQCKNNADYNDYAFEVKSIVRQALRMQENPSDIRTIVSVENNTRGFIKMYKEDLLKKSRKKNKDADASMKQKNDAIIESFSKLYSDVNKSSPGFDDEFNRNIETYGNEIVKDMSTQDVLYTEKEEELDEKVSILGTNYTKRKYEMRDRKDYPLFGHEPNAYDVRQGDVGDCVAMAGLVSIMENNPDYIKEMMKDEGETVLVRFFTNEGTPRYVRVAKSVPYTVLTNDKKEKISADTEGGARTVLWVQLFEKAYAAIRSELEGWDANKAEDKEKLDRPLLQQLRTIPVDAFMQAVMGKKMESYKALGGSKLNREGLSRRSLGSLFKHTHYDVKKEWRKTNKGFFYSKKWNMFKAKEFFGIDLEKAEGKQYRIFQKNRLFEHYQNWMEQQIAKFTERKLHSTTDLDFFLDSIPIESMPEIDTAGLDSKHMKQHFLGYFKKFIKNHKLLENNVCRDGNYDDDEKEAYDYIKQKLSEKKLMTASSGDLTFAKKEKDGLNGERTVAGIASHHAYTILDVREEPIAGNAEGQTTKYIILRNPWDETVRLYDKDTGAPYLQQDGDNHGVFKMELRDFYRNYAVVRTY